MDYPTTRSRERPRVTLELQLEAADAFAKFKFEGVSNTVFASSLFVAAGVFPSSLQPEVADAFAELTFKGLSNTISATPLFAAFVLYALGAAFWVIAFTDVLVFALTDFAEYGYTSRRAAEGQAHDQR